MSAQQESAGGKKCVYNSKWSKERCFTKECGSCYSDSECITQCCQQGKCVYHTNASYSKCFPSASPSVPPTYSITPSPSSARTPRPSPSMTSSPSSSKTPPPSPSMTSSPSSSHTASPTPTPTPLKPDCKPCKSSHECNSYMCTNGKCGSKYVVKHCPKYECDKCCRDSECKGGKCWNQICTDGSYKSLVRCGYKTECKPCKRGRECATRICKRGRCIFDTNASYRKCCKYAYY